MAQGKQVRPNFTRLFSRLRAIHTHQRRAACCFMSALGNAERFLPAYSLTSAAELEETQQLTVKAPIS
ncbi:hypothetical protein [Massilia sp. DWR3-1-1]|uniref:hypothetical protein n=1 Tax=Massilia sp. DWR3-1-1 TaxID=2804559 RepID=UPI003CFA9DE9